MEQLPIDMQEIIYKKAYKMQFDEVIQNIPCAWRRLKRKKMIDEHNVVWVPLFKYLNSMEVVSKDKILELYWNMRSYDMTRIDCEIYNEEFDERIDYTFSRYRLIM
jgi:hypothetical protein